jgi:hypothetical protein
MQRSVLEAAHEPFGRCAKLDILEICYNTYNSYIVGKAMSSPQSIVVSMRLPAESGRRLKRMASRHGWTASDASARLVEEGLRRAEFAFIDFRDSAAGRQAYVQGSALAVWEVALLLRAYKQDAAAVARHLGWPEAKVRAADHYAEAFPAETAEALADNDAMDLKALKRMLPQAEEFVVRRPKSLRRP